MTSSPFLEKRTTMKLSEINVRDPFILSDIATKTYYLYGTMPFYDGIGFYCYTSKDLDSWSGPFKVFTPKKNFWGTKEYWAPEVHIYHGQYYMFASFKGDGYARSTQILCSSSPMGPFHVHSNIVTPKDWECLDGTLYVDKSNNPYMIFCHEWLQIDDGTICAVPLSDDLKDAVGDPVTLFKGSDAKWSEHPNWSKKPVHVTDGPFVYEKNNVHILLWSTYGKDSYKIGIAHPQDSFVKSGYIQEEKSLPIQSGGHGMIFTSFEDKDYLVVHVNNEEHGKEYPIIIPISFHNGKCEVSV